MRAPTLPSMTEDRVTYVQIPEALAERAVSALVNAGYDANMPPRRLSEKGRRVVVKTNEDFHSDVHRIVREVAPNATLAE